MKRIGIIIAIATFFLSAATGTVFAYAIPSGIGATETTTINIQPPATSTLYNDWQSFINGFESIENSTIGNSIKTDVTQTFVAPASQNILSQIDSWIYSHLGFHISTYTSAALGILSWLYGLAKAGVDWVIRFLR